MMEHSFKTKDTSNMDCAQFQDRLPELFESGVDLSADPHLMTCSNCSSLVRDLEYIAQQAKLLLPLHDPSPEVWTNIQSAIRVGAVNLEREDNSPVK